MDGMEKEAVTKRLVGGIPTRLGHATPRLAVATVSVFAGAQLVPQEADRCPVDYGHQHGAGWR